MFLNEFKMVAQTWISKKLLILTSFEAMFRSNQFIGLIIHSTYKGKGLWFATFDPPLSTFTLCLKRSMAIMHKG